MKTCRAKKVFRLSHDAPSDEAFIEFANELHPLDSMDLGDAMGAFCELATREETDSSEHVWVSPSGFTVTMFTTWDSFIWARKSPYDPI